MKYGPISSLPCSFYVSILKHEPPLKGNTEQIQREIQMCNAMEKHIFGWGCSSVDRMLHIHKTPVLAWTLPKTGCGGTGL